MSPDAFWRQLDATIYVVRTTGDPLRGKVELVSGGTLRLLGYDPEEFQHNPELWNQLLHPDDVASVIASTQEIFRSGKPNKRVYRMRHKVTGQYHWIEDSTVPLRTDSGDLEGIAGVARDITELRQKQDALEHRQHELEVLFDAMPDGVLVVNDAGEIVQSNAGVERILGWTEEEVTGHPVECLLPERMRAGHVDMRSHYAAEPRIRRMGKYELVAQHRTGREVPVDIMIGPLPGDTLRFLAIVRDMTETRVAREQLALLSALVKSSEDSIVGSDSKGRIISWNRGAERLFGYSPTEILGQHFSVLIPEREQEDALSFSRRALQGERPVRFELALKRKDGGEFDGSSFLSPIEDSRGTIVGISLICRDVSERNRLNAELQTARRAAEVASQAKSEFLGNMSHELRTPLNGIIGLTEVVLDTLPEGEEHQLLTMVRDSATSLLTILSDILDITRLQAGKYLLHPKEFWIRDLVGTTMRHFSREAEQKRLELSWSIHPDVPAVLFGDPNCLRQVLSNLVGNAIKYTAQGEVSVDVRWEPESQVCFEVRDTGIGVPRDQKEKIFEAFSQSDNSLRRSYGGTGLGLAICAELAEVMGGRIGVESDGKSGSTFRFCAPLRIVENTD